MDFERELYFQTFNLNAAQNALNRGESILKRIIDKYKYLEYIKPEDFLKICDVYILKPREVYMILDSHSIKINIDEVAKCLAEDAEKTKRNEKCSQKS